MKEEILEIAKFWSRVKVTSVDHCWNWMGTRPYGDDGYGRFNGERAHRFAYRIAHGEIPEGMVVRHHCDNKRCVNPLHLAIGTHADNTADAVARNRMATGERHGKTKLTYDQVLTIRASTETGKRLAEQYGVSESTIHYIKAGRSWKMVGRAGIEPATSSMSVRRSTDDLTARGVSAGPVYDQDPHPSRLASEKDLPCQG